MKKAVQGASTIIRQWPRVVAESIGLRRSPPVRPAAGRIPDAPTWHASRFAASWLGHATVLLRLGETTILTDPHFQERAGVRVGPTRVGRRRDTALPGTIDDLPPIDVVMLSHAHLDHWDKASLKRLAKSYTSAVIPRGTRRLLPRGFGSVTELAWDQSAPAGGTSVLALRPRHWGARYFFDRRRGYNSYVIEGDGKRLLFAGDTAHTDAFDVLARAGSTGSALQGGVDLAIMGIGNYAPWEHQHATPEQAAAMAERMGARRLMPIHHSTFRDRSEPIDEPMERLLKAWNPSRIICSRIGESWFCSDDPISADALSVATTKG